MISWLPAAHIAERMAHHYIPVVYAGTDHLLPEPARDVSYLPQVRPTWFFAVPRIWEKLKAGLEAMQAAQPEEQRRPIQEALEASLERVRLSQRGEPVPTSSRRRSPQADAQMFSKLREMLGLDQAIAVNVGAAPTRSRCSSSSTRSGSSWRSCGGCRRRAGSARATAPGEVRIGTVGPASRASSSRSPMTASCSFAATA